MNSININGDNRNLAEVNEGWINQQIRARQENGENVCVRVSINIDGVHLNFATSGCGGAGGGRGGVPQFNDHQKFLIEKWNKAGLGTGEINPGLLIAFLKQTKAL